MRAAGSVPAVSVGRRPSEVPSPHPVLVGLVAVAGGLVIGAAATLGPVAAVGALGAALAGIYLLRHPVLAAALLVGAVPALSGLKRGLPVPGLRLSEILVGALAVSILLTVRKGHAARWQTFDWLALLYASTVALLGAADVLMRGESLDAESVGALLAPFQFLLLYRAVRSAVREEAHRVLALRVALLAAVPVCLVTFLQAADVGGIRALLFTLTSEPAGADLFADASEGGVGRATGPFVIWHTLSAYLWLVALLAAGLLLRGDRRVLPAWGLASVVVMAGAAILLTISATPVIALVAGLLWLGYSHGRFRRVALTLLLAGAVGAAALGPSISARTEQQRVSESAGGDSLVPQTLSFRYEVWTQQYLPVIERNLLTGYGPGLPPQVTWQSTESIYVTMLLRGGVPLLLVYLALTLALVAWARSARRARDATLGAAVAEVVAIAVILLFAYQALVPLFMITGMPHLLWGLAGLIPAASRRAQTEGPAAPPAARTAPAVPV